MIKAKTVIPDQYWILRNQDHKIGNIEIDGSEYVVSINGRSRRYQNLEVLSNIMRIDFDRSCNAKICEPSYQVHGYPTSSTAYNAVFDVKHQLPLWTQEPRSRSWLAAGWYQIKHHCDWQIVMCPKLIILQRYEYQGPFASQEKARQL